MHTRSALVVLSAVLAASGCTPPPGTPAGTVSAGQSPVVAAAPRVLNVRNADAPAGGMVATTVLHDSPTAVTRIMRLAPGSVIPEHHHPSHDEAFFVHAGTVLAVLDGREHTVRAGDLVQIPAGTVIAGRNPGTDEAIVVVAFAGNGRGGPLTVPGQPHH